VGQVLESGEERGWIFSERVRGLRAKAWMWWIWGEAVRVLRMWEPCFDVVRVGWGFERCLIGDCLTTRPVEPASTMDAMLDVCCGVGVEFLLVYMICSFSYVFYVNRQPHN